MREEAELLQRLIFETGVTNVQRPGDCVDLQWGDYDGDTLKLWQNKTDTALSQMHVCAGGQSSQEKSVKPMA